MSLPFHNHHSDLFPSNLVLSGGSTLMAFLFTTIDPLLTGLILPIAFFIVGKAVDVVVRLYLEKKKNDD